MVRDRPFCDFYAALLGKGETRDVARKIATITLTC